MDDLIRRQAAVDAIEEYSDRLQMVNWKENPGVPYKAHALNWCINTIRELPSAQPTQSNAVQHVESVESVGDCISKYNFCPNCGSEMRENE